ncbi:MAG: MFS transporter, partial [Chloroflexi bacterium]
MIGVGLFGLAIGFNAATLDPFIFSEKVRLLAPPSMKNTLLGFITILALLTALMVQPLVGQWSDHTRSRWGKRAPYLAAGVVGLSFALALIVLADSLWLLILGTVLMSMFANTTQAAWQALIPDHIPVFQHGTAAGAKTVLELTGVVAGIAVVGYFLSQGNVWASPLVTSLLFFVILAVTLAVIHGRPVLTASSSPQAGQNALARMISGVRKSPPAFLWWMLNRILFWSAAISVRTFILNYLEDVFGLLPAEAEALSSR